MAVKRAPERIEEKAVAAQLAGRVRKPGDNGRVTLSGRCGRCGYLLGSPGHGIACGTH